MLPKIHIEIERWKYNKEFNCWVSNMGNIKDRNKRLIKIFIDDKNGYSKVIINNKVKNLHRIVLETWNGKSNLTIDHLDHNKRNNKLSNLEYVSEEENLKRAKEDLIKTTYKYSIRGDKHTFRNDKALINYCYNCINKDVKKIYSKEEILERVQASASGGEEFLERNWMFV